jgi:hypothetical protein
MRVQLARLPSVSNSRKGALKLALLAGAMAAAALLAGQRAEADAALCGTGINCRPHLSSPASDQHFYRFSTAHNQASQHDASLRRSAVTAKDYPSFSGVGVISCMVGGKQRTATAFLVGAFDIGVTVAHMFQKDADGAEPDDCTYNSLDSLGQVRERIPVSYVKSQWDEAGAAGQLSKDFAVVRLSQASRYAQRTMPLGRFSGAGGFTHDMDSRDIAPGAPVIDESTGVIIGIHAQSARNTMITMNDWLESTLRSEMQQQQQREARAN